MSHKSQVPAGWLAVTFATGCVIWLVALVVTRDSEGGPSHEPLRALTLGALAAASTGIGALGAWSSRASLLLAAGLVAAGVSLLAFNGVLLVFLIPAALFFHAAGDRASPEGASLSRGVIELGIVCAIVIAAALAAVALFSNTETICWQRFETAASPGFVEWVAPDASSSGTNSAGILDPVHGLVTASGCDGGIETSRGVLLEFGFLSGALALAATVAHERRRRVARGP